MTDHHQFYLYLTGMAISWLLGFLMAREIYWKRNRRKPARRVGGYFLEDNTEPLEHVERESRLFWVRNRN